jgi:hypothetical protein
VAEVDQPGRNVVSNNVAILDALQEQVSCYRKLSRLAEAQREHVQRSHMEGLLSVLQSRQAILEQLQQLEFIIGPAKKRWSEFLDEIEPESRAVAEKSLAESRRLLEQIMASDRTDALALEQRKLNLGKQINQTAGARKINRNYAVAAYGQRTSRMDISR